MSFRFLNRRTVYVTGSHFAYRLISCSGMVLPGTYSLPGKQPGEVYQPPSSYAYFSNGFG